MRTMADPSSRKGRWLFLLAIYILYFIIACLITWPLITQLGDLLVGRTTDAMVHYWNGWWFQRALQLGQSPFFTDLLNFPEGVSLITHNFAFLNIMPWLLLEPLIGGIPAYNLIILLYLALCGWAMYQLAYELLRQREAAFIAGLIYMAWPFRISQLDHPNLIATSWIPFFFLFLIRMLRNGRWLDALWAGIALALVGYTRWQLLIPVSLMTLVYLLARIRDWLPRWRETLPRLVVTAAVAIVALLPPAVMLAREQLNADFSADVIFEYDEQSMSTDLLAYLLPSRRHFALRETTREFIDRYYPDRTSGRRYPVTIGYTVLLLAIIGLVKRWRSTWVWLLMALIFIGLAAGMVWRVNGQTIEAVPTLYKILAPLQVMRLMRVPERYVIFLALPMALLAAYGWQALISSRRLVRWRVPLTLLLAVVILLEYQSTPLQSVYTDYDKTVFEQLAQEPGDFAILNIPLRYRFSKEYMFEQTFHERPILQGHVSREPDNLYRFIKDSAWLSGMPELEVDPGNLMAKLQDAGVGYVVLSQHLLEDATWRLWRRHVPYEPYYKDDRYLVYATAPEYGRDLDQPIEIAPGLGLIDQTLSAYCAGDKTMAVAGITWATTSSPPVDYGLVLEAVSEQNGVHSNSSVLPLVDMWPTSQWSERTVTRQSYTIDLPPEENPHTLALQLVDLQQKIAVGEPISLGEIDRKQCTIDAGAAEAGNVLFGDSLRLLSYAVTHDDEELVVKLNWLGEKRPGLAYKFFVHVFDKETKEIVAQVDTMPLNWRLPTSDWKSGELVADEIRLSLDGVPPGTYQVAIGVYEEDSGERLPITNYDERLQTSSEDRLILKDLEKIEDDG